MANPHKRRAAEIPDSRIRTEKHKLKKVTQAANSPLLSLADELLLNVLEYLGDGDFGLLRSVCRKLCALSAPTYFRVVSVIHQAQSVANLQQLAERPDLGRHVREIKIRGSVSFDKHEISPDSCAMWHLDLASAIRCFPALEMFTIDNGRYPSICPLCNCIFQGAIGIFDRLLESKEARSRLSIDTTRWSLDVANRFDPKSRSWRDNIASNVNSLKLWNMQENSAWLADLLESLPKLHELHIRGQISWNVTTWPNLKILTLKGTKVPHDDFVTFITLHSATLSSLRLMWVMIIGGTCEIPLQKITMIEQLTHLELEGLCSDSGHQDVRLQKTPLEVRRQFKELSDTEMVLDNSQDIKIASEVFRHYCWSDLVVGIREYPDLRLAQAVINKKVKFEHGQWEL